MDLSWGQWLRLGIGAMAWMNKHRDAVNDAVALWQSVVPAETPSTDGISHAEAIAKLQNPQSRTPAEQTQLDRETRDFGGPG